ncbi:MAG: ABC transporter substrate-binding protein, partial [Acidisphaera sp.]|nr:ABC transporter substrate-binding protein [Acidisphaera sp.]
MEITRRQAGALGLAALLGGAPAARAANPGMLVRSDGQPRNLDPHQVFDVPMMGYALNAYDTLYRYEDNPPKMQPWLADGHTVSDDGLNWQFKLRQGVKFHDG